jgi:predicted RNase H-like nuclease
VADRRFIGIDMAWRIDGNHSGIAVMRGDSQQVSLAAVSTDVVSRDGVVAFVRAQSTVDTVVAIDASLVVNNPVGQRRCETAIAAEFGRYHASCHTSNLGRPFATTGMELVAALGSQGFRHDFQLEQARQRSGRWIFEVYPHPAMIRLFRLERIIKYKKGSVAQKRAGLAQLRAHLQALCAGSAGLMRSVLFDELMAQELGTLRGETLKRYEDTLDAVFCAYLAWHCWRWGAERNQQFGTLAEGYIVVPKAPAERPRS